MGLRNIAILWTVLFVFFSTLPGRIEGIYFPVVDDFVLKIEPSQFEKNASDIYMSFYKTRPSCEFRNISFFLHEKDKTGHELVILMGSTFKGEEIVRFVGSHMDVGPWVIRKPISKLKDVTIVIEHDCHGMYNTITNLRIKNGIYVGVKPLI